MSSINDIPMSRFITETNRKWWTLATVCFALLMIVLDSSVVNLAIPKILAHFGATISQMEWVNNGYLLAFAVFLITFGRLGDEIGRKKMFMGGLVVFTLGSLLSGLAGNVSQLVIFRVLQGLGGAAMMPATLSLISSTFAPKERGTAMGAWGAVAGVGIALGPILGGYIADLGLGHAINTLLHVSQYWRFIFFINLPIGVLAFLAAWFIIRESKDSETKHRFDLQGILFSALSIFFLTFGFIEGQKYGWWFVHNPFTVFGQAVHIGSIGAIPIIFALSIIFFALFVGRERHTTVDPLVDTKLFQSRNFTAGNITVIILALGMMGSFFLLPLFLQTILGFSAIKTGTVLLPLAAMLMVAAPISGKLADRLGGKWLIVIGLAVMAVGTFWIGHFTLATTVGQLIGPFLVIGFGMGMCQAPLTNIALLDIPPDEAGGASGVFTTARQVGSVMGIAILGAFLQTTLAHDFSRHIAAVPDLPAKAKTQIEAMASDQSFQTAAGQARIKDVLIQTMAPTISLAAPVPAGTKNPAANQADIDQQVTAAKALIIAKLQKLGQEVSTAAKQAFTDSINDTFKISAMMAVLGSASALLFTGRRKPDQETPPPAA